ncbi:MAG: hypothetical protein ABJ275_06925 [Maricaulaceae bacterium]
MLKNENLLFNEDANFVQLCYAEWKPQPFILPLKDVESGEEFFGRNAIPLAKGGKIYELKGHDDPLKLYGCGPRLIVLVEGKRN